MPQLICNLHDIAIERHSEVLAVTFNNTHALKYKYKLDPKRNELIDWLNKSGISFEPVVMQYSFSYLGDLFVDIPYDPKDPLYMELQNRIEDQDGNPLDDDIILWLMTLERAESWAEQAAKIVID